MSGFQRLNNRAAKVNGEMVMWIRQQYAAMVSYPVIRAGLQQTFGVVLSIQQITRIAKGESFAQLPTLPTDREVDLTMRMNALHSAPQPVSQETIDASIARLQALVAADEAPRPGVLEIMQRRLTTDPVEQPNTPPSPTAQRRVLSLEEIEARERAVLGTQEGSGLDKLMKTAESRPVKPNAEKLLETLKDETTQGTDASTIG